MQQPLHIVCCGMDSSVSTHSGHTAMRCSTQEKRAPPRRARQSQHGVSQNSDLHGGHRVERAEARQVVLVWRIVAVPGHHVEWRERLRRLEAAQRGS